MRQPRRWNGFSHESPMSSESESWYLVRSFDGRFRYILAVTAHDYNILRNDVMYEYVWEAYDSKRLALLALSSPNIRHPNEPEPRMLCKCKRGCNKESKIGSIFCSDCTRACTMRMVEPWTVNWYSIPSCFCDNLHCCYGAS